MFYQPIIKKHDFTGFIHDKVHRFPTNPLWQALRDVKNQVRSVRFITRNFCPFLRYRMLASDEI